MANIKRLQQKMKRKQILRAWEHSKNDLDREKPQMSEQKLRFNITYCPAFQNVRTIMEDIHILLTPNKEHKKVFPNMPVTGFWNGKSHKGFLVRAALLKLDEGE